MRKGKTVIGQDVLSLADGTRVHTVKDLIIGEATQIVALLVDEGGLLSTSTVVPIEAVNRFGKDAVVIADSTAVIPASADARVKAILNSKDRLVGKTVYSTDGQELGSVADMYFDEVSGRIDGLEISGGKLADLAKGTSYLAADEIERSGPDMLFVRPETATALTAQIGGVQGALQDAAGKASNAAAGAQTSMQDAAAQEQERQAQEREQALVGQRSGTEVTDEKGAVVVAKGQLITAETVERARASGNLPVLLQAADAGKAEETQQQHEAAIQQVGDSAADMWDRFTSKIGEMTDAAGQRVDQQQTRSRLAAIADAVGRPVTKVILDRDDRVVLDLGDIITHQAVQQANDAGMLETLLGSVYTGQVEFARDEMKARQEATSSVDRAKGGASIVEDLEQRVEKPEQERAAEKERSKQEAEQSRQQRERERQARAKERTADDAKQEKDVEARETVLSGVSTAKATKP